MRVRYSPRALKHLDDIRRYLEKDNPKAAWVVAAFIKRSISTLEDFPYYGRATDKENVRRLAVLNYPYIVYYRVREDVVILSVRHEAQRGNPDAV